MSRESTVSPAVFYKDPSAAIEFLERAFGFELTLKVTDDDGNVGHAQLSFGDGGLSLGPVDWSPWAKSPSQLGGANTGTVHIQVADVDAHHAHAVAAGATIEMAPTDQFYGDRTYRAVDPEGHRWTFSQTVRTLSDDEMSEGEWTVETIKR